MDRRWITSCLCLLQQLVCCVASLAYCWNTVNFQLNVPFSDHECSLCTAMPHFCCSHTAETCER